MRRERASLRRVAAAIFASVLFLGVPHARALDRSITSVLMATLANGGGTPPAFGEGGFKESLLLVNVNGEDQGLYFLATADDGSVLAKLPDLEEWGFDLGDVRGRWAGPVWVPLDAFSSLLSYEADAPRAALFVDASPELFGVTEIHHDRSPYRDVVGTVESRPALFLNEFGRLLLGDDLEFESLTLPLELGGHVGGVSGLARATWTDTEEDADFRRDSTSLYYDDLDARHRWTLGDTVALGSRFGSAGSLAGIRLATEDTLRPDIARFPVPELGTLIDEASEVDVYVNGSLVLRQNTGPGRLQLLLDRLPFGAGDVELVIRDRSGREERIFLPYYQSSLLLREGYDEYSIAAGVLREDFDESFDYGDPAGFANYRLGVTDWFTAGAALEASADAQTLSASATTTPWGLGEVQLATAVSLADDLVGYAGFGAYQINSRRIFFRLDAEARSSRFRNVADRLDETSGERLAGGAALSVVVPWVGALTARGRAERLGGDPWDSDATLSWDRSLPGGLRGSLLVRRSFSGDRVDEVRFGLTYQWRDGPFSWLRVESLDEERRAILNVQESVPRFGGTGYRFEAQADEVQDGEDGGDMDALNRLQGQVAHRNRYLDASAEYIWRDQAESATELRLASALVAIDGGLQITRPVTGSFALVKVGEIPGVPILLGRTPVGVTDGDGEFLIPDLTPYWDNRVGVGLRELGLEYRLLDREDQLVLPFRGGSVADFEVDRLRTFTGTVVHSVAGERHLIEVAPIVLEYDDDRIETVVGRDGILYLENPAKKRYRAQVELKDGPCGFWIDLPEKDGSFAGLGELECEAIEDPSAALVPASLRKTARR